MHLFYHHSIARGYRALVLSLSLPFFLITGVTYHCQAQKTIHILKLRNARQLHQFFHYTGNDIPLVSGHRGGMTAGFPENCIPSFENNLRPTPAFFEVDPRLTKDRSEEHTFDLQSIMRISYAVCVLNKKITANQ